MKFHRILPCILAFSIQALAAVGFHGSLKLPAKYSAPTGSTKLVNPFVEKRVALLNTGKLPFEDRVKVDFESRAATLEQTAFGHYVWLYHYPEIEVYMQDQLAFSNTALWHRTSKSALGIQAPEQASNLFEIEIPVSMPDWAKRFAGDEGPKLSITGWRKITFEGESKWVVGDNSPAGQQSSRFPQLKMKQDSKFTVRGKVGRLIDISITDDSEMEDLGQQLKDQVKIHYKGEGDELEDEIIQEVEAGNTQMSLPNTEFSGYSESHKGLFGIRMRAKVGDLDITTVASQEKGEGQKAEFRVGQAQSETFTVPDFQFLRNYFFLDSIYANYYRAGQEPPVDKKVKECMVFISRQGGWRQTDEALYRPRQAEIKPGQVGNFQLLREGQDYELDRVRGYIAFNTNSLYLNDPDAIGVYFRSNSGGFGRGDTAGFSTITSDDSLRTIDLEIIKPPSLRPGDPEWGLLWKNVYSIGMVERADAKDMKIEIMLNDTIDNQAGRLFTSVLGLADPDGKLFVDKDSIFRFDRGEVVFPIFDGILEPFANNQRLDIANPAIYDTSGDLSNPQKLYTIKISAVTVRNEYNLGMNVIQNTDRVKLNGRTLERNQDYTIDYESGRLVVTAPDATQGSTIQVDYESESIFIAEQKVFLGSRLEYKMPFISDESFIGFSTLYKSESISELNAQIGREPYRKILLDANTKLVFSPAWMTKAANALPLVETEQKSRFEISAEVARSIPNPNLKGEAMVDDFEGADLSYPLGLLWSEWKQASPPGEMRPDTLIPGTFWWSNPVSKVAQDSIWRVETAGRDRFVDVLNLQVRPTDTSGSSWGGVMRALMPGTRDQSRTKFLEITARSNGGGKLLVDVGRISEDLSINGGPPNEQFNREDKLVEGRLDGNLALDEDVGLDGVTDTGEIWIRPVPSTEFPGTMVWDTLGYGDLGLANPRDPSGDNYNQDKEQFWHGTQGNSRLETRPESEDINNSGYLDRTDSYFRFELDLSDTSSDSTYYVPSTDLNGWRLYRIPLAQARPAISGTTPNWRDAECVRMVLTDLHDTSKTYTLQVAKAEFASNQWRETGDTSATGPHIEVSVVNTEQNREYQPRVPVARDANGLLPREQSLAISYSNLGAGQKVMARRLLSEPMSLINYETLKMDLRGHQQQAQDSLFFFLRFGSDSSNYYEYRTLLRDGWQHIEFPIQNLSALKEQYLANHPGAVRCDTVSGEGLGVYGMPQFTNCKEMYTGVLSKNAVAPLNGTFWLNDLKVSDIHREAGWAGRLSFDTKLADIATLNGYASYRDGNFVKLGEPAHIGNGNASVDGRIGTTFSLDKFMSARWGVSMPLTASIAGSLTRPRYLPGSDAFLSDDRLPDIFGEAINSIVGRNLFEAKETPASLFQSKKIDRTLGLSYAKNSRSDSRLVNLSADRVKWNYGYTNTSDAGPTRADTNLTHSGTLTYDLTPQSSKDYRPLAGFKSGFVPSFAKGLWIRPLPNRLNFTLANAKYAHQKQFDKRSNRMVVDAERMDLSHRMEMGLAPINSLTLDYDLGVDRNFDDAIDAVRRNGASEAQAQVFGFDPVWRDLLLLRGETNRVQGIKASFSPNFVSWLTHQISYDSDYRHYLGRDHRLDLDMRNVSEVNVTFMPITFMGSLGRTAKPLEPAIKKLQAGLSALALNNIGGRYSVTTSQIVKRLDDVGLSRWSFFRYQTGLYDRSLRQIFYSGEADETSFGQVASWDSAQAAIHRDDSRRIERTFRGTTGFQLPMHTSVSTSLEWSRSVIAFVDRDKHRDTTEVWPNWDITASNYEFSKLPGLRKNIQSATITTSYRSRNESRSLSSGRTDVKERGMDPMWNVRLTWKNGVESQLSRRWTRLVEHNLADNSKDTTRTSGDSLSLSYSVKKEKGMRFLRWKTRLRNDLKLTFDAGWSKRLKTNTIGEGDAGKTNEVEDLVNFNFGPGASYYFSDKIDAGMDINYGRTTNKIRANEVTKSVLVRIWAQIHF